MSEMTRVPFITRVPITNKIYGYIYLTTCIVNEKQYIGQHKWNKHHIDYSYIGSGTNLKKDIRLYGKDNFITQILDWGTTKDELNKLEIEYIQRYNAVDDPQFYNLSYGGENFFEGKHHSEVSKKLIREHSPNLGRKLTDAEKKRIGDFHRGKVYSEETRKKISMNNGMRGKRMTDEMRKILIKSGPEHPRYGTHHTQESIIKISEHRKGKTVGTDNPASRAIVRLTLDGKFVKYYSYIRLVKNDGFDPSSVGSCCRGEYKQHLGYKFMYLEDYKHKIEVNLNE